MEKEKETAGAGAAGPVVALVADLIFASRIRGASGGGGARTFRSADELLEAVRREPPRLVLVDLDARGDPVGLIRRLREDPGPGAATVVAFGSHVARETLLAARDAGADEVLARSAFVQRLPALLSS